MKPTLIAIFSATIALFTLGLNAQTYTAIISGENSQAFSFLNGNPTRPTVTSIQSPFAYPNTITGSNDMAGYAYPVGNSSATPPYWFKYTGHTGSLYTTQDLTGVEPYRYPS